MKENIKTNRKCAALSVLLIIFIILTLIYTSMEMHHECSHELYHEECPICRIINISILSLELLCFAIVSAFVAANFHFIGNKITRFICNSVINPTTLISQKIRIND